MTPDDMLEHMKEQEQRENELIAEANETSGAVKWDYKPLLSSRDGAERRLQLMNAFFYRFCVNQVVNFYC